MYQPDFIAKVREQLEVKEDPAKLRQPKFETSSGITLKNSYTPADIEHFDPIRDLGKPGKFPFKAGPEPAYRARGLFSHFAKIGDTRSLIQHPASTTHRQLTDEQRLTAGARADVIRLSVALNRWRPDLQS